MSLKKAADNLLFILNLFILVIVVFNKYLNIPVWIQPIGRMHPLILHFPIVLLILTLISVLLPVKNPQYRNIREQLTEYLLLSGAVSASLTVITGLFLSKEAGYEGMALQVHMWTGISIVFVSSFIYWFRTPLLNHSVLYKTISLLSVFLLAVTGHYGATLTHGEDFIFPPQNIRAAQVKLQDAIVFDHVVMPIIHNKCASCHNKEKSKGSLLLTDSVGFLKGGKTGKLFNPANLGLSLLLKRIHLPEDDEKKMPPPGKPVLTEQELTLLELWVARGAGFTSKVIDLPAADSLRELAGTLLDAGETYDFPAADEAIVESLNNNDRLVSSLAAASPALAVKLYNRNEYNTQKIQELLPVKTQVVSLDLNKLPVKDEDIKVIAQFPNLRKLNLNFSAISGATLGELAGLKHLKAVSLSGTQVEAGSLAAFQKMASLQQITLWNTNITAENIALLKKQSPAVVFITGFTDNGVPSKLIPPQLENNTVVFNDQLPLAFKHPIAGVNVFYTIDGTEPDSLQRSTSSTNTVLSENTTVKARAYKTGWYSSDIAEFNFLKHTHTPDSMYFLVAPYENYRGDGAYTFFDGELGGYNIYRYTKNKWVGFKERDLELMMQYKTPQVISSVALHALISVRDKTLPPAIFEIWGGTNPEEMKLLARLKPVVPGEKDERKLVNITGLFKPENLTYLKIKAEPMLYPVWSPDKGKRGLLLIDEILIN